MSYPGPAQRSPWRRAAAPVLEGLLDLIYPRLCCLCKVPLAPQTPRRGGKAWFCEGCEAGLPLVEPPYCHVCGETYDGAFTKAFRCQNCGDRRLEFEFAVAACRAEEGARELIHQFKYERRLHLRAPLAALLLRTLEEPRLIRENLQDWLLVPVPLHRNRELDREFNQSWELCRRLSQWTGIPATNALERRHATDSQAGLDREQRLRNLRGAFGIRHPLPWQRPIPMSGRSVLLVDDVFTTGATTSECARVLKREGGAEKVVVITVARG
ncbi:MAG: ComF family protein [Prosthecobacter sp.]